MGRSTKKPFIGNAPRVEDKHNFSIWVRKVTELLQLSEGQVGDVLDKKVTFRDLKSIGVVDSFSKTGGVTGGSGAGGGGSTDPIYTIPTTISGLRAINGTTLIFLEWDKSPYFYLAYVEVWRSDTDNVGNAVKIGQTQGTLFADDVGSGSVEYFYWVRIVSTKDDIGPWNAVAGVSGQTHLSPSYLLEQLSGQITETELYGDLNTRIDLIDAPGSGLVDGLAQELIDRASAISAESSARVSAITQEISDRLAGDAAIEGEIVSLQSDVATLNSSTNTADIAANATAIGGLDTRITTNEGDITAISSDITALQSSVISNDDDIAANATAVGGLNTRVTTSEGDIASIASDVTSLQTSVTSNSGSISGNASAISGLDTRVTSAEGSITSMASDISSLQSSGQAGDIAANASAISALDARVVQTETDTLANASDITTLQTDVTSNDGLISGNASAISGIDTRVTTAEGNITSHASDISSLQTDVSSNTSTASGHTAAISGLDTRVTATESAVTANASDITALEADVLSHDGQISTSATAISGLDTRVTQTESDITANASDITSLQSDVSTNDGLISGQATAIGALDTRVTNSEGDITAVSSDITTLSSTVTTNNNTLTSAIQTEASTRASETGALGAKYSVKLDVNGHLAGFGLSSTANAYDDQVHSQAIFSVDTFSIASPGATSLSFVVDNGKVLIDAAYIHNLVVDDAAITNLSVSKLIGDTAAFVQANIGALSVTNANITGYIQSDNYVPGTTGWHINKNGNMEARGTIVASHVEANAVDIIDTLHIKGNAVFLSVGAEGAVSLQPETNPGHVGSWVDVVSRTIDFTGSKTGQPIIVDFRFELSSLLINGAKWGGWGMTALPAEYRVLRNNVLISPYTNIFYEAYSPFRITREYYDVTFNQTTYQFDSSKIFIDQPGSGVHTYKLQVRCTDVPNTFSGSVSILLTGGKA